VGGEEAAPCLLDAGCEWGHCAETGDYYSAHGIAGIVEIYYTGVLCLQIELSLLEAMLMWMEVQESLESRTAFGRACRT